MEQELVDVQMRVEAVDPTSDPDWDRQVLTHPAANAFHSAAWSRVLAATYGHQPCYLRCTRAGRLLALVPFMEVQSFLRPRRGISLPFSDFCDALIFDPQCEEELFQRIGRISLERGWRHIDFRGAGCVPANAIPAVSFHSHRLDLTGGPEAVASRFRPSVRQALRKVARSPLTVSIEHSESAMRLFYPLHALTRGRHGLPPQSLSFFLKIHRELIARQMGFIVVVRLDGRPIASMVFFHWGNTAIYKFGASDKAFQQLRPNNLAMATGIQTLAAAGAETLHFGRSSLANDGLRRFKLSWGSEEGQLHYYRYETAGGAWRSSRDRTEGFHLELFRRLPASLNRLAGTLIYAHLD